MEHGDWAGRRSLPHIRWWIVGACLLLIPNHAAAVEQAEQFIEGLLERGYTAEALEYLDRLETSRLLPAGFGARLPYHRAVALLAQARRTADSPARAALLGEARRSLDAYLAANPGQHDGVEILGQLANALVEQAKHQVVRATRLSDDHDGKREQIRVQAREYLDDARGIFEEVESFYSQALAEFPKNLDPKTEDDRINRRQELRGRLAQARILIAQSDYEKAKTFDARSDEFRKLNETAAAALDDLFQKYSRWLVGFYAHLYEGRCYQALGEYKKALGVYDTIVAQPDVDPAFRKLITSGYRHQVECFVALGQLGAAATNAETWLRKARSAEEDQAEWLALRFRLAEVQIAKSEAPDASDAQRRALRADARDNFRTVANRPGEFQRDARTALTGLGAGDAAIVAKVFSAAYDAGKNSLAEMNTANASIQTAKSMAPESVDALEEQVAASRRQAITHFAHALTLADDDTDRSTLNEVRYYLSWLYFQEQQYFRAALLGEFVARRYPSHTAAPPAAKLAMAAYERLYQQAVVAGQTKNQTEFEARQLARLAEFITRRWPGTDDAENAFTVLLNFAIRNDRLDEARRLLSEVAPERRTELQLKVGIALWSSFLATSSSDTAKDQATAMRDETIELLTRGIDASREMPLSSTIATAALYLAQAHISAASYAKAIAVLEDEQLGPLSLMKSNHAAVARPEFASSAYKSALQAYVSVVPPQGAKALAVMDSLSESIGADGQAAEKLTRIYISLGVQLEQQIDALRAAGQVDEAERVTAAFAEFLDRVGQQQQGASWAGRSWIAQTFFGMGESLPDDSAGAREYFQKARQTYEQMLANATADATLAPSETAVLAARKKLGECLTNLGEYKLALDMFSSILAENESRIDVQKSAAYAYQSWGQADDSKWLERAIGGGYRLRSTGKNRIWGWARIASVVKRYMKHNESHRQSFFEAWLNTARCRYFLAQASEGAARTANLNKAKVTIRSIIRQYPDLGGSQRRAQFDQLAKEIQQAEGVTPRGLDAFVVAAPGR